MVTKKQILQSVTELTDLIKSKEFEKLKTDSEELKKTKDEEYISSSFVF